MKHLFPVYLFVVIFVSCNDKAENKDQTTAPTILPAATNPISPSNSDSTSGIALNPQHGQPGHRCDIAVGAPLNTPAASNSLQSTVATNPVIVPTDVQKVTPNTNNASIKVNPKHGEPGHRCDIAVGAPLDSKPNQ